MEKTQGIGRATAVCIARDSSVVVLAARNGNNLKTAAEEVEAGGAEAYILVADLSEPEDAKRLVDDR